LFSGPLAGLLATPPTNLLSPENGAGLLSADSVILGGSDLAPIESHQPFRGLTARLLTPEGPRFVKISGRPLHGSEGDFLGYRGTGVDVTFEVRRYLDADAQRQNYENVVEAISEGLALFDADDRLVLFNKKYQRIHQKLGRVIHIGARFKEIARAAAAQGVVVGAPERVEEWLRERMERHRNPGEPVEQLLDTGRWLLVNERKMPDGGTVSVRTDITDLKLREIALKESETQAALANHAKSEFLANMSHELRTPLNAVIGFSEAMETGIFGDVTEKQRDCLRDIHAAGTHLLDLINEILDLSKIESGKIELREDWVAMDGVIESCLRLIRPHADEAGVTLDTALMKAPLSLWADEQRLKQVLLNLLSNAVKFTPTGGRVTICLNMERGHGIELRVIDNGIGMRPEDTQKALEPFYQVESALSRSNHGTGLGLPLSKRLVECHGGTLDIESELGNGTTVVVRLPMNRVRGQETRHAG
jgi:signal transduction histidine kinase